MRFLIIGGTGFLGRQLSQMCLDADHEVTLFNRGQTNPSLFPDAEVLYGDRTKSLEVLQHREWDVVIDTCGHFPKSVKQMVQELNSRVKQYIFISTCAVYADLTQLNIDETHPVQKIDDSQDPEASIPQTYGARKALCEAAVRENFEGVSLIIRPGIIVGEHDPSGRFTYWLLKVASQNRVVGPGSPKAPMQFIDARDLTKWIIHMASMRKGGTYNAVGPQDETFTFESFLTLCQNVLNPECQVKWVNDAILKKANVRPWLDIPLWAPPPISGIFSMNGNKAYSDGLSCRPISETIGITYKWALFEEGTPSESFLSSEEEERFF